jgi:two-component system sporulation sensor kinase A
LHLSEYVETRNVKLYKKIGSDAIVNIDSDKFYQACFQIARNACDAMPDGGNLYVTLKKEEELMKLEFRDEGAGIPLSIKEEVFEPFLSHGKPAGVGLGLTIAEKIIKDHNGSIRAEGEMGEGTTIVISIPCVE